jgi:hypothetical protein
MKKSLLIIPVLFVLLYVVAFNVSCLQNYSFSPTIPEPGPVAQSECIKCHTNVDTLKAVADPLPPPIGDCSGTEG